MPRPGEAIRTFEAAFIGGSPCAGKSTVADLLGRRHGITVVHCDDGVGARHERLVEAASAQLRELTGLSRCERLRRDPRWQADMELLYYREQFPLLLEELRATTYPCLVEGADLLPELLPGPVVASGRAVWLVPTPEFQLEHYRRRAWAWDYVAPCPDPGLAFDGWMRRDMLFADRVATTATAIGGAVVEVDGSRSVHEVAAEVERRLGLG